MQVHEHDLLTVEDFKLRWRWTEPKYNTLPADAIARIRPLTVQKAEEVWQSITGWVRDESLAGDVFGPNSKCSADRDRDQVCDWLTAVTDCKEKQLIVSWDHNTAVLVECWVFCRYWDDFCYPASDDVLVFPATGDWALLYHHEENFVFGHRRSNLGR